jgi:hypothetical protein
LVGFTYRQVKSYVNNTGCKILTPEEEYINGNTKIDIKCFCGNTFERRFNDFRHTKQMCFICSGKELSYEKVRDFINNTGCILVTTKKDYKNTQEYLEIQCKCTNIFLRSYTEFKRNAFNCVDCSGMARVTYERIKKYIISKNCKLLTVKSQFEKKKRKLKLRCHCGKIVFRSYRRLGTLNSCIYCSVRNSVNYDIVKSKVELLGYKFKTTSKDYVNTKTLLSLECPNGHLLERTWNCIKEISHLNCKECTRVNKIKKLEKQLIKGGSRLLSIDYWDEPLKVLCKCNNTFYRYSRTFTQYKNYTCRTCSTRNPKAETEIAKFLNLKRVCFNTNDRKILRPKELDFYIEEAKLAIEHNGLYWHSDQIITKNYHITKTKNCSKQGIKLYHIFEDEWRDSVLKTVWKSLISSKINNKFQLKMSNCTVNTIPKKTAKSFFKKNSLESTCSGSYKGVFYKKELIFVGIVENNKNYVRIKRFAFKKYKINSKSLYLLLRYCKKQYCKSVKVYNDLRYPYSFFRKLGFQYSRYIPPNFWYTKGPEKYTMSELINLQTKIDSSISTFKFLKKYHYNKIFDCGKEEYTAYV